jgi:dTDP-4-amino-4,6-dideoxygalactose transaminase
MSNLKFVEYESLAESNKNFMFEMESAVSKVIRSGWYILGSEVSSFEEEFARYTGAKYCLGVGNGLDALVIAIDALELPRGSEVLVASNTYIATILAIIRAGHVPVLVEPDIATFNINPSCLMNALSSKTRAVCVTHLFGKPCRMDLINTFVEQNGLKLIEDCAQSHGALFGGQMTGTFGDVSCFSFYPTKNLGALGDAGAIITNNPEIFDRIKYLRNYGSKEKYVNSYLGFNSRLDELQAALLRVKLRHLDGMIEHKRNLAKVYFDMLPDWVIKPSVAADEYDVFHIFGIRFENRDGLRSHLLRLGVKTEIHYPIPPHQQKAMREYISGSYPVSEALHKTELSLPISVGHDVSDIEYVSNAFRSFSN